MTTNQVFASEDTLAAAKQAEKKGDKSQAETLYKKAIDERAKATSSDDGSVGEFTHELGRFYLATGNDTGAEETLKKALEITEKAYYAGHSKLVLILDDIADLYIRQGKFAEAEPVLVRLLDICDKTMNSEHRHLYETMHKLGYVYRKVGKGADAEKLYLKALKTIDSPLGPAEEFRLDLALIYDEMGKNDEADKNFRAAIAGIEQRKNLSRLVDALIAYSEFLKKNGKTEQAKKATDLAQKVRETASTAKSQRSHKLFCATLMRA